MMSLLVSTFFFVFFVFLGVWFQSEKMADEWEKYTDNEPIDLERSATAITVEKRMGKDGRVDVKAIFPLGPTPLYFGPPFTFDSSEFVLFLFFFFSFHVFLFLPFN